jgi:hypothetical protein
MVAMSGTLRTLLFLQWEWLNLKDVCEFRKSENLQKLFHCLKKEEKKGKRSIVTLEKHIFKFCIYYLIFLRV